MKITKRKAEKKTLKSEKLYCKLLKEEKTEDEDKENAKR